MYISVYIELYIFFVSTHAQPSVGIYMDFDRNLSKPEPEARSHPSLQDGLQPGLYPCARSQDSRPGSVSELLPGHPPKYLH